MTRDAWQPLLDRLTERREAARAMGGPQKLATRAERGRATARGTIAHLLDADSFVEFGVLAGEDLPADAFVAGWGTIEGRPVFVGAEDGSVAGGSIGTAGATKRARLIELARRERRPLVLILDGAGHRATNALRPHRPAPNDLQGLADLVGLVPIATIVIGPSAGHGALAAPMSDYCVMVTGHGALFTAGPPLVAAASGEQVSVTDLGGPAVHLASGLAHAEAPDAAAACAAVRQWLGYLPDAAGEAPPREHSGDVGPRATDALLDLIPVDARTPYDMTEVIDELCDHDSVLPWQPGHGPSLICALTRLGGHTVAVVANQPLVLAGSLDVAAADKGARFLDFCGTFGLPVLFLTDNPGVLAGSASERAGILRASSRMFLAQRRLRAPKLQVTIRKAFGFGSSVMAANPFDAQSASLALPTATLGGIPAKVGGETAKEDEDTRAALAANESSGPWRGAAVGTWDDIVDPRELRNVVLSVLARGEGTQASTTPEKVHTR